MAMLTEDRGKRHSAGTWQTIDLDVEDDTSFGEEHRDPPCRRYGGTQPESGTSAISASSASYATEPSTLSFVWSSRQTRSSLSTSGANCHECSRSTSPPSLLDRRQYDALDNGRNLRIYLFPPPAVTLPVFNLNLQTTIAGDEMSALQTASLSDLLVGLAAREDAPRKMAVFKLQSLINDPSYAEAFVAQGGVSRLRQLISETSGNTLSYALASFSRLLEMDQGWEGVDAKTIQKAVEIVVCEPLVNILRGALSVLVSVVSRPQHEEDKMVVGSVMYMGGFKALKPAISLYPQFLEMLVGRLSSADHSLCANALQLINSLMRDAITSENEHEWPKFIKRIQDLGVIKAVYVLMQSSALQDLALPLLDFQSLTKVLLRRWREVPVNLTKPEHRRTIKALHLSSNPEKSYDFGKGPENQPKHNPYKWRRLGFMTESPEPDFEDMGFLGMMDLSDYVRKHQDEFQHILIEQASQPVEKRCPLARASLVVTAVLFEHFEVDKSDLEDAKNFMAADSRTSYGQIFKPLLLHWSRLHVAGLHAFLRLWKATGAKLEDFYKIVELIRILVESVVGSAERAKGIEAVEQDLASFEWPKLRELQMELLELTYQDIWGQHLLGIKEELRSETLQFVQEQRIRCLLMGAWFPNQTDASAGEPDNKNAEMGRQARGVHKYIRLSSDRQYLYYGEFDQIHSHAPSSGSLPGRIDLQAVTSVVSNVTASDETGEMMTDALITQQEKYTTTKISIHGYASDSRSKTIQSQHSHRRGQSRNSSRKEQKEAVLLTFQPPNHTVAAEWLDGLLMLLDQQPITAETNNLVNTISDYGVKVRLLNVRFNDEEGLIGGIEGGLEAPPIPSREGLDEDYFYEI